MRGRRAVAPASALAAVVFAVAGLGLQATAQVSAAGKGGDVTPTARPERLASSPTGGRGVACGRTVVRTPEMILQTGRDLRRAIDQRYLEMSNAHRLVSDGHGLNVITDVVVRFLPVGTPFSDAERILSAAGFALTGRGNHPLYPTGEFASINNYRPLLLGGISVAAGIKSTANPLWSCVSRVDAEIVEAYP